MKRLSIILLVALLILPAALANETVSTNDLFNEFSSEAKAESVNVNSFLMWVAKRCAGKQKGSEILDKISSVKVLDLESCNTLVKERFATRASQVSVKDMEPLVEANDDGNKVKVLAKIKDETIQRLLVICYGTEDCCLVEINGKFKLDELDGVVKSQIPRKNDR